MATTPTAVREALVTQIAALSRTTIPARGFVRYKHTGLRFDKWALQNIFTCFRTFDLRFEPAPKMPLVHNGATGRWRYPFVLSVLYPREHYKTLDVPVLELDQAIEEDTASLIPVLRDYSGASYVAEEATFKRVPEVDSDDDTPITILRFGAVYEMWRDA